MWRRHNKKKSKKVRFPREVNHFFPFLFFNLIPISFLFPSLTLIANFNLNSPHLCDPETPNSKSIHESPIFLKSFPVSFLLQRSLCVGLFCLVLQSPIVLPVPLSTMDRRKGNFLNYFSICCMCITESIFCGPRFCGPLHFPMYFCLLIKLACV